ncbi:glycoside hydrolase family 9 protein [Streptosporangiaceae bacterium NEAU-GS5]|nr:glycoside hydrolase family 9 protein [Streptosporangiaceae bacterium NEAU-GS5]
MRSPLRVAAALAVAVTLTTGNVEGSAAMAQTTAAAAKGFIRVDQVGYGSDEAKHAYFMTGAAGATGFTVVDAHGKTVLSSAAGPDRGSWNASYPHVFDLDFGSLTAPGTYRIKVGKTTSPAFTIAPPLRRTAGLAVRFFQSQRDGADVVGDRKPSHLNDRAASVYAFPTFAGPDTDEIKGRLRKIGGPVDAEGGWFDAGDYLKFTHILAYVDTLIFASERDGRGKAGRALTAEARHGLKYLDKMWDEKTKTLYIQVGIGSGNDKITGDHDVWRMPEGDDHSPHPYLRHRPVFRAAAPGRKISPNLAGRTAAAFALASQVTKDRAKARALLAKAAGVYGMAKTTGVKQLVTSLPFAFYPETAWRDDMELGATELALAAARLGDPRASAWLKQAAHWASQYLEHEAGGDTLNLYDVSALAHRDLVRALDGDRGLAVTSDDLIADLKAQLEIGAARAAKDPFRAGADHAEFDAVPHAFGLAATARLYRDVTGDNAYDAFGTQQRNWVFGANPWGVSFMVGAGADHVRCPHYQMSNITGRPATGAVVNGPNNVSLFEDGLGDYEDGMTRCPANGKDRFAAFTGHKSRFVDDVRSWQASEPADDFAAIALYALTLQS